MRLLSVQTGTPRRVGTAGAADPVDREFTSAIWKEPVTGPIRVGVSGLEGDAVADRRAHGGLDQAILMYAGTHYPLWRLEWGSAALTPGGFGENLTVSGLTEDTVCIGDVLDVGEVRLQVSQTRQPCATLARRHRRPDLVKEVLRTGRSGWYLRVLREGMVTAGLPIDLAERPNPGWSVRSALLALRDRRHDPGRAAALAACRGLSEGWRAQLRRG